MWEKFLLAAAVTFSLHIFAGIDLSDIKSPISSDSKAPTLSYFEENLSYFNMTNKYQNFYEQIMQF
ncbi:hypothetical protein [Okeania sp.]|uniref:hypothetical protein n=1 Tax=Okeania sp. TaxID=3100323 RepID=UPI002B4B1B5F|nr:hypothetical protein [Okeania sp.]MEB3342756.1 hypothetical protein [Okeania sp.]